jgi:hypothetical protein
VKPQNFRLYSINKLHVVALTVDTLTLHKEPRYGKGSGRSCFLVRPRNFSLLQSDQTDSGTTQPPTQWAPRTQTLDGKAAGVKGWPCTSSRATKSTTLAHICGSSVWNSLHITHLGPRILRWLLDFWIICAPLPLPLPSLTFPTTHGAICLVQHWDTSHSTKAYNFLPRVELHTSLNVESLVCNATLLHAHACNKTPNENKLVWK